MRGFDFCANFLTITCSCFDLRPVVENTRAYLSNSTQTYYWGPCQKTDFGPQFPRVNTDNKNALHQWSSQWKWNNAAATAKTVQTRRPTSWWCFVSLLLISWPRTWTCKWNSAKFSTTPFATCTLSLERHDCFSLTTCINLFTLTFDFESIKIESPLCATVTCYSREERLVTARNMEKTKPWPHQVGSTNGLTSSHEKFRGSITR